MTKDTVQPRRGRGKAAAQRAADQLTAERIRAILSDPKTPGSIAGKLQGLISALGAATDAPVPETPDFYAHAFAGGIENLRGGYVARLEVKEAREAAEQIARLAERHEPQPYRVARRIAEIYDAVGGDGASYFVEHVDAVLEGGDGLLPNPDSKYFLPLFVEAWNDRGPRDRKVRKLLDLIKRVDEGADLNQLAEEDKRAWAEYAQAHKPKDTRLIEALSEILRDPADEQRGRILTAINDLSNETPGVSDLHPDIFPTLARVLIREARKAARGRSGKACNLRRYLGELESVAAGG